MTVVLNVALFLPLVAGLLLLVWPRLGRNWAVGVSGLVALASLALLASYSGSEAGFVTQVALLEPAGIFYAVGLDGLGLFLWVCASLTVFLGVWIARVDTRFLALALIMQTGLLGIFAARDLVLFYVFFEATLIPALFMLGLFGGKSRFQALYTFALFTLVASLPMLAAIMAARILGGSPTFLLTDLLANPVKGTAATWVFLGFMLALLVKTPLFPLHAWLPQFHQQNHPSGLADAMGTLYKVGVFAFFRWAIPIAPEGFAQVQTLLMVLAAFSAVYGAWVAFSARDWKTLLAYGGVSHMGLAALGLFSGTSEGAVGALFLLGASMIYTGGLFLFAGLMEQRLGSLEIGPSRGLARSAPGMAALGLILVMAMVGLPGLSGFPGEFMVLLGAYQTQPWLTLLGFLAIIGAAAYALTAYQKVFHEEETQPVADLAPREWGFAVVLVLSIVVLGLYPKLFTQLLQPLARVFDTLLGGGGA